VAATAIAALVQLRHLRAGNQIAGQLAMVNLFQGPEFESAMQRARRDLPRLLTDTSFRTFVARARTEYPVDTPAEFIEVWTAASLVGSHLENIGNMVRNGLTDRRIFLEQWTPLVTSAWTLLEPIIVLRREATRSDTPWEDFEYLTVLSRDAMNRYPTFYPKDTKRILPSVATQ
jgi:diadenosine tetraphosphatase ApaH/serine/threonine PP2A family protein phosphatase